jgi:hypothetical protein
MIAAIVTPVIGWYSAPGQKVPEFDPGIDGVDCPLCLHPLNGQDLRTYSLCEPGATHSIFYRTHKSCAEANPDRIDVLDIAALDIAPRVRGAQ